MVETSSIVICILTLPPPLHGQSMINAAVVSVLSNEGAICRVFNSSPGTMNRNSLTYHTKRVAAVMKGCQEILRTPKTVRCSVYMPHEAGLGSIYNFAVACLIRIKRIPLYMHHHTSGHTLAFSKTFDRLSQLLGSFGHHIALCPSMATDIMKLYPTTSKVTVCENAQILSVLQDSGDAENSIANCNKQHTGGVFTLGYIANITKEKGIDLAVQTFEQIMAIDSTVKFLVAGAAMDTHAMAALESLPKKYPNNVEIWGPVYGVRKREFFNRLNCLIFPSIYKFEAQPLVILEAQAQGIPVYATKVGYIEEMLPPEASFTPDRFVQMASELILSRRTQPYRRLEANRQIRRTTGADIEFLRELLS